RRSARVPLPASTTECGILSNGCLSAPLPQLEHERRSNEDGRIRTSDDAESDCKRKTTQHFSPEYKQHYDHEQGRRGGNDRTAERRVDRLVDHRGEGHGLVKVRVFSNTVENDDRVVDRIADDRKERRDDRLVDLQRER